MSNRYKLRGVSSDKEDVHEAIKNNETALIVIKSTIPVGHSRSLKEKYKTERIVFSPEFLREGKALQDNLYPSRIIVGSKLDQAKKFDILLKKYDQKITCVFRLNVDKKLILKRILGRQTCTKCENIFNEYFNLPTTKNHPCGTGFLVKRSDDNEETILYRYKTYIDETLPILEYYNKLNLLYEIDGSMEIDKIFNKISLIMASMEA